MQKNHKRRAARQNIGDKNCFGGSAFAATGQHVSVQCMAAECNQIRVYWAPTMEHFDLKECGEVKANRRHSNVFPSIKLCPIVLAARMCIGLYLLCLVRGRWVSRRDHSAYRTDIHCILFGREFMRVAPLPLASPRFCRHGVSAPNERFMNEYDRTESDGTWNPNGKRLRIMSTKTPKLIKTFTFAEWPLSARSHGRALCGCHAAGAF